MLSLLNAGFLPWLAAVSVPVVIHLLTKRTRRRIDLPTAKFLQKTLANQSQLWRWRHLLTLILRTLAMATIVAAFLKPSWLSALAGKQGEKAGVVILFDVSESMAYSSGGVDNLTKAKIQAREALRGLGSGDRANVVFCGAQPTLATETPTEDHRSLDAALQAVQPTEERADGAGAVGMAVEQLAKMNTAVRRLIVISDFQRTNWADVRFETVPPNTKVAFVSVDEGRRENVALTSLRSRPATPRIGETTTIQAEVFNSSETMRRVPVDLRLSDGRRFKDDVSVPPFSSGNVSFPLTFDKMERVELTASIGEDNLTADNSRRTTVDLRQMANVVLLTDEDLNAPTTAAFYLARALHPDPTSSSGFRVLPTRPRALNNPLLKAADAVIVCNTPGMPAVQSEALARYVLGGGNLMWVLYGDRMQEQLAAFGKHLPKAEPLPLRVESVANIAGQGQGYVTLSEARYESRLLKAFRDTANSLSAAKFTKFCITSEVDARGEMLLKYEDGTAAAVRTGEGSGNLLLLNMSPAPGWSDLARQDIFVPLLHEFLNGILLRDSGQREATPGGPASTTILPTKLTVVCQDPNGRSLPVALDKTTGSVVVERVGQSGFYHLYAGTDQVASIPVNPAADESDLRTIDPRELETKRQRQASVLLAASGGASLADAQRGTELWPYLLGLALLSLLLEQSVRRVGTTARRAP
ncbi:MAG: BatA domain-containing protein [Fimbriimonas sp.]